MKKPLNDMMCLIFGEKEYSTGEMVFFFVVLGFMAAVLVFASI